MEIDVSKVSRLEVIGHTREYVNMDTGAISLSVQDDGRTLKIFISK